jgi:hypothetical protein
MSSKRNLAPENHRRDADRWTITIDLTNRAIEIRNDLRSSLFILTRTANGEIRSVGSYDRRAFVRALAAAAQLRSDLGFDLALAGRLGALGGAQPKRTAPQMAGSGAEGSHTPFGEDGSPLGLDSM